MKNNSIQPTTSAEKAQVAGGSDCYKKALWYPLLGLAVALLVPESFVADSEILKGVIVEAGHWIPAINNISAISDFPMVTGLYLTVMWVVLPFAVWWWLVNMPMANPLPNPKFWQLVSGLILGALALALFATFIYWFPVQPDAHGLSWRGGRSGAFLGTVAHIKLGLALFFGAIFYVFSLFVMGWLRLIWLCAVWLLRFIAISL
jgi:hypothetical protein